MKTENEKCGEIFRSGPGTFLFTCAFCAESFDSKSNALDHIENHFLFKTNINDPFASCLDVKNFENCTNINSLKIEIQQSSYAHSSFDSSIAKNIKQEPELEIPEKNVAPLPLNSKQENHPKKKSKKNPYARWGMVTHHSTVECDICQKKIKKFNLLRHLELHLQKEGKNFSCSICQKKFSIEKALKLHIRFHAWKKTIKKHICQYCGVQYEQKRNLENHIRSHTGVKPYKCNQCPKEFSVSFGLTLHTRTHTGERPYHCKICNKTFTTCSNAAKHKRMVHNKERYKCDICGNEQATHAHAIEHYRTHTGERPYQCDVCSKTFNRQKGYAQHILLHSNEKRYKCNFCNLTFVQYSGKRYHMRSVHKDLSQESQLT